MSEDAAVLWFAGGDRPPPDAVDGHTVASPPADDGEAALAAVAERRPAGVVYALADPRAFLEGLREHHPHLPAVVVADPDDCEAAMHDDDADLVCRHDDDAGEASARLGAILGEHAAATAPVETLVRYETILETVGDGVYALDADYRYVLVNDALCELTGSDREALLGEHVSVVLTGEDLETGVDARTRAREDPGTVQKIELKLERADGTVVPVENRFAAVDVSGTFAGTVGVVRDVTERRERERELRRKTESLEAFASLVGHDLRNPLAIADGYLEQVEADVDHPALDDVRAAVDRMGHIVEDLLLLVRGDEALSTGPVALDDVARSAWQTVRTADATLDVRADRRLLASEGHLRSLLENLFRNSVEHAGDDVTVAVGSIDEGFYVADDGPGFPPDVRDQAFDRGVSGDGGTGLVLFIVRAVADAHGWTVTATDSEDGGARVEVRGVEETV